MRGGLEWRSSLKVCALEVARGGVLGSRKTSNPVGRGRELWSVSEYFRHLLRTRGETLRGGD